MVGEVRTRGPAEAVYQVEHTGGQEVPAASSTNRVVVNGVFSAGLITTVFPVDQGRETFQTASQSG